MKAKIRNWNTRRIEQRRLNSKYTTTPEGFLFKGAKFQFDVNWEPLTRKLVSELSQDRRSFVNIGAHYGFYSCLAAHLGMRVTAFEPIDANFSMLRDNLEANNFTDECRLFHGAVGDRSYLTKIYGAYSGASLLQDKTRNSKLHQTTQVFKLSDINFKDEATLILMDVEGFELSVLEGAKHLLNQKSQNTWIIETSKDNSLALGSLMFEYGYSMFHIGSEKLRAVSNGDLKRSGIDGDFLCLDLDSENNRKLVKHFS